MTPDGSEEEEAEPGTGRTRRTPAGGERSQGRPARGQRGGSRDRDTRGRRAEGGRDDRGRGRDDRGRGRDDRGRGRDDRGRQDRGASGGTGRPPVGRDELLRSGTGPRPARLPSPRRRRVPKPPLPEERPQLPRPAYRELKASVPSGLLDEVMAAYALAGQALADGEPERALPYLEWAKSVASRSGVVREALGIARYQLGEYAAASSELTAYRRMTGLQDQNHLLADCARAAGRHDKVVEEVEAMERAERVGRDRVVEGLIVLASDKADRGDLRGAMAVLERADLHPRQVETWHPRLWYVAADLADRMGRTDEARDYLEAIVAVDPDYLDAAERLDSA